MALTGIPPAVFRRDGNPDDPRSQRTRRQVLDTFEDEIRQGRPPTSVAALVRVAGISRSSFYLHFTGIEEVGVAAMREILEGFDGSTNAADRPAEPRATIVDLFGHLADHRELSAHLLDAADGRLHPANSELRGVIATHFVHSMKALGARPPVDPRTTATFLVGGLMAMLVEWLAEPHCTSTELASTFARLVPPWLAANPEFDRPLRISSPT